VNIDQGTLAIGWLGEGSRREGVRNEEEEEIKVSRKHAPKKGGERKRSGEFFELRMKVDSKKGDPGSHFMVARTTRTRP